MMPSDDARVAAPRSRDAANWADSAPVFHAAGAPPEALNWLEGREVTGPLRGFGPLWQKTYTVPLTGVVATPQEVIRTWKERFPTFWPPGNHFYEPLPGIAPGEVALINADLPGGLHFSTGVMVLYADEEQFTFTTPQGHVFAGWVTFSAFARDGQTVAQVEVLVRSPDPLMELGLRLGGYRQEDRFWAQTLGNVAAYFGVAGRAETHIVCRDRRILWRNARNIRYNPLFATIRYALAAPWRAGRRG